jgi:preprotein translocase subunit SecA
LEYDDVLNQQRSKIYEQRDRVFLKGDLSEDLLEMLHDEIQLRVGNTLWEGSDIADQSSPWRLLAWITQIQPPLNFQDRQLPSYTIRLLLDEIRSSAPQMTADEIIPILLEVGRKALAAEEDYLLNAVDRIVDDRQFHYQDQLDIRFDTLDTFLEGLSYGSEEPVNPQEVFSELRELTRTRFELNPNQIKELVEGVSPGLEDELKMQIQSQLELVEIKRLIGAVERLMGASLDVDAAQITDLDWVTAPGWLSDSVRSQFQSRRQSYFDHPDDPRVKKSIEAGLKDISSEELSDSDLVKLLGLMAEGRQAAFDKKSHRRIWLRTQRLRYHFYAAELLTQKTPEEVEGEILDHFEDIRLGIRDVWGDIELNRLKDLKLTDLDVDLRELLVEELGEDALHQADHKEIGQLAGDIRTRVQKQLGSSVMNKIYRDLFLRVISELWVEYLTEMEALRVAIGLEAYAQRDPLVQYKSRGFEMFQQLMENMRVGVVSRMFTFQPRNLERIQAAVDNG